MRGKRIKLLKEYNTRYCADNYTIKELKHWWKLGHLKWQLNIGKDPAPNRYLG